MRHFTSEGPGHLFLKGGKCISIILDYINQTKGFAFFKSKRLSSGPHLRNKIPIRVGAFRSSSIQAITIIPVTLIVVETTSDVVTIIWTSARDVEAIIVITGCYVLAGACERLYSQSAVVALLQRLHAYTVSYPMLFVIVVCALGSDTSSHFLRARFGVCVGDGIR